MFLHLAARCLRNITLQLPNVQELSLHDRQSQLRFFGFDEPLKPIRVVDRSGPKREKILVGFAPPTLVVPADFGVARKRTFELRQRAMRLQFFGLLEQQGSGRHACLSLLVMRHTHMIEGARASSNPFAKNRRQRPESDS